MGRHALLYINEKLRVVSYASEIMPKGTEQATTSPQRSVLELGKGKLQDYLGSISVLDCVMGANAAEACLCLQVCYSGSLVHRLGTASKHGSYTNVINLWMSICVLFSVCLISLEE